MSGARLTPYELAFSSTQFQAELFPAIRAEAAGTSAASPDAFLMLGTVGRTLRELRPGDAEVRAGEATLPPPEAVHDYGRVLFQAWQFWSWGLRLFVLDGPLTRHLLGALPPIGEWDLAAPHPAGYVQLPRNLLWARVHAEAPAEPVDGFFWTTDQDAGAGTRLDLLLVLGMNALRPGFSILEAGASLPAPAPGHWADLEARPDEPDFTNRLPGGELSGLFGIVSVAEALKLASRVFHYIATQRAAVTTPRVTPPTSSGSTHELPASSLPASLVTLKD